MSNEKTYVFTPNEGSLSSIIAPLLQQRGIDPNILLAMRNNNGWGDGSMFWWVIFLFFLMGWGNNGWGGNRNTPELVNQLNNDYGRDLLMQAIQGNANAISQLASNLNCSVGNIQTAINSVQSQICQVGNQVGMSGQQIINSIQNGNAAIASKIADCCCENRLAICEQTNTLQGSINSVNNSIERGFAQSGYANAQQTCEIVGAIKDNTAQVLAGQRAAEMRELSRELAERDRRIAEQAVIINNGQQSALFGQMISQAVNPLIAGQQALQKEIADVQCKLPQTVTLPYSCATAVPTCVAAQYGLNAWGNNNGFWG